MEGKPGRCLIGSGGISTGNGSSCPGPGDNDSLRRRRDEPASPAGAGRCPPPLLTGSLAPLAMGSCWGHRAGNGRQGSVWQAMAVQGTPTSETRRRRYLPVACEAPDGTVQPVEPQAGTRRAPPLRVAFGNRGFGSRTPRELCYRTSACRCCCRYMHVEGALTDGRPRNGRHHHHHHHHATGTTTTATTTPIAATRRKCWDGPNVYSIPSSRGPCIRHCLDSFPHTRTRTPSRPNPMAATRRHRTSSH